MDYDEEDNGASGSIPDFGAIFMSNSETMKECFERKVFALPYSKAEFVRHIKAGMVLFLFEFHKRRLFGVYQASSDGAMNIVPHGFSYSGRHFPAQVRFSPIWHCDPLSEKEFKDAIINNYFSSKKFNFGLSGDQVRRLLFLFSSRKLINRMPPLRVSEDIVDIAGEDRRILTDDRLGLSVRGYMKPVDYDEFHPEAFSDHHVNSSARVNEDKVLADDGLNPEGKVNLYSEEDYLAKKRRLGNDVKLTKNDVTGNGIHNHDTIWPFQFDSPEDSLDEVRRLFDDRKFFPVERLHKNQLDRSLNHTEYLVNRNLENRYQDSDLNSHTAERELIDDLDCFRKLENRYHRDCDGSPISTFEHPDKLRHIIRKSRAAGRPPINDIEPEFVTCSGEGFSSGKFSRSLQCGHRITHERRYPIMEGRINENMVDNSFCSNNLAKKAVYSGVDRQMVDHGGFRKSKLLPEKGLPLSTQRNNVDLHGHKFDDATITRVSPYSPEHQNISHGCSVSITPNQNYCFVRENHPQNGPLGNFYMPSKVRLPQHLLEPENFTRPLDIAPEFGNEVFPTSIAGLRSSLLRESTNPFVNSHIPVHMDPHTSVPINFRGSLFSNLSPPYTDFKDVGGEKDLFAYTSNSRESRVAFDEDLPMASQHVRLHKMGLLADKDFSSTEAKDFALDISPRERDWTSNEKLYSGYSCSMNLKELHKLPEAPHANSDVNRRSVFTRLTSKENSKYYKERNDIDFSYQNYVDASADQVMEMLQQSGNVLHRKLRKYRVGGPPTYGEAEVLTRLNSKEESKYEEKKKDIDFNHQDVSADEVMEMLQKNGNLLQKILRKSRVGGQPTNGEISVGEKTLCPVKSCQSRVEKNKLHDASLSTEDGIGEVPKETRIVGFKRRRDRKILVGNNDDSNPHNKISCANEEVKNPVKTTLKQRKLVRPDFGKTGSAIDAACNNGPAPVFAKDDKTSISMSEAEMPIDTTRLSNLSVSYSVQPMENNVNVHQNLEEQKDVIVHGFPSIGLELDLANVDHIDDSQALIEKTQPMSSAYQISPEGISRLELDLANVDHHIDDYQALIEKTQPMSSACQISPEGISRLELDLANVDHHIDDSQALIENTQPMSSAIQISPEGILTKGIDSTLIDLNQPGSCLEGPSLGVGSGINLVGETHHKIKKRKKLIKRPPKSNIESS